MKLLTRKLAAIAFATTSALLIAYTVYLSSVPAFYFSYDSEHSALWRYEGKSVLIICGFMLIEAAITGAALLAPWPRALWLRCAIGFVPLFAANVLAMMAVLHMPLYVLFHHSLLAIWLLVVIVAAVGSIIIRVRTRARAKLGARAISNK